MKRILIIIPLLLLVGCTNKVEENKYAYLEYKSDLEEHKTFNNEEETDFNTYFNITRENEEVVEYTVTIEDSKTNMYNVKALLIHDYLTEEAYPSIGILDNPVELKKDTEDKIVLNGKINSLEDISSTNFKLYLEYTDEEDNQNKIYYKLSRG